MGLNKETKTLYTIKEFEYDGDMIDGESIGLYFETYEDAKEYLLSVLLPELEEDNTEKEYWRVTSIEPDEFDELYEDEVGGVIDERDKVDEDFYVVLVIKYKLHKDDEGDKDNDERFKLSYDRYLEIESEKMTFYKR